MTKHDNKTADELILDNAPEGATDIDDVGDYWIYEGGGDYLLWDNGSWFGSFTWFEGLTPFHTRSLAEIKALIDKDERIAELEEVLQKLHKLGGLGLDKHKWIEDVLKGGDL